ncbi:MAG: hypothetical protein V7785_23395 [Bermanella sp.]
MVNKIAGSVLVLIGFLLVIFLVWYSPGAERLTKQEVNNLIGQIRGQSKTPGGQHDIPALQQFLNEDDGQPFYTVNLYKYYEHAQYQYGSGLPKELEGSGREAFDRFSEVMVGLLAKHASHPIFGSDWMDTNIAGWDRLVIVRYRSRRDIAQIFASDAFAQANAHKWAGLEKNQRLLVQGLHIPELILVAAGMLLMLLGLGFIYMTTYKVLKTLPE